MNEFELRRSLGELPRCRAPSRDLWPGVEAHLDAGVRPLRTSRWHWLALAAAAALAALLLPAQFGEVADPAVPLAVLEPSASWPSEAAVMVDGAEALPSWMLGDAEVLAALVELEESTAELHVLIEEHPESAHLVSLLHTTYEKRRWLNRFGVGQGQNLPPQET
jgi:hypothetical protein